MHADQQSPSWLLTPSGVGVSGATNDLAMVWIDATPRGEAVDLECIGSAEADRRVAQGQFPSGVMLGRALYRQEATKQVPAPWVQRAQRVVVCDVASSAWLEALGPSGPQVRFLPAPFGPRSFGYLLSWLAGTASEAAAWEERAS